MRVRERSHRSSAGLLVVALSASAGVTACRDAIPPSIPQAVQAGAAILAQDPVHLTDAVFHIEMIQLEGANGTPDWTWRPREPMEFQVTRNRLLTEDLAIPAGEYDFVRIMIHRPRPEGPSVLLGGTVGGENFRTELDLTVVIENELSPAVKFTDSAPALTQHAAFIVDPSAWFKSESGGMIDPRARLNQSVIERSLRASLKSQAVALAGEFAFELAYHSTASEQFPIIVAGLDGSVLLPRYDQGSLVGGVVFNGDGVEASLYLNENGLPAQFIIDGYIVLFDNYDLDAGMVDIAVVEPGQETKIFRELAIDPLALATVAAAQSDMQRLVAAAQMVTGFSVLEGVSDVLRGAAVGFSGGLCAASLVATLGTGGVGAPLLLTCGTFVVKSTALAFEKFGPEEWRDEARAVGIGASLFGCYTATDPLECTPLVLNLGAEAADRADAIGESASSEIQEARGLLADAPGLEDVEAVVPIGTANPGDDFGASGGSFTFAVAPVDADGTAVLSGLTAADFRFKNVAAIAETGAVNSTGSAVVDGVEERPVSDQPLHVMLSFDRSGSMSQSDPSRKSIAAGKDLISRLRTEDLVGVIAFNSSVAVLQELTTDHRAATDAVDGISFGGGTNMYESILVAADRLQSKSNATIVVLSDGVSSEPPTEEDAIAAANGAGATIFGVGLGSGSGVDNVRTLAERSGGVYGNASDDAALEAVFEGIALGVTQGTILVRGVGTFSTPLSVGIYQIQGDLITNVLGQEFATPWSFRLVVN